MNLGISKLSSWIEDKIKTEQYGEIQITIKIHDGKPTLLERSFVEKIQLDKLKS